METLAEAVGVLRAMEPGGSAPRNKPVQHEVRIGDSAKRIMRSAQEIAASLSHPRVHWGHILLALAEGEIAAVRAALERASLTSEGIREHVGDEPM
jgi:hypothetical protein